MILNDLTFNLKTLTNDVIGYFYIYNTTSFLFFWLIIFFLKGNVNNSSLTTLSLLDSKILKTVLLILLLIISGIPPLSGFVLKLKLLKESLNYVYFLNFVVLLVLVLGMMLFYLTIVKYVLSDKLKNNLDIDTSINTKNIINMWPYTYLLIFFNSFFIYFENDFNIILFYFI